jgi:hypothetical protein
VNNLPCKVQIHLCDFGVFALHWHMPENDEPTIRETVSLPESVWRQIEDYQFGNRIKRETEAIRRLIEAGLAAAAGPATGGGLHPHAADPKRVAPATAPRAVGPEDEDRAGSEAPADTPVR